MVHTLIPPLTGYIQVDLRVNQTGSLLQNKTLSQTNKSKYTNKKQINTSFIWHRTPVPLFIGVLCLAPALNSGYPPPQRTQFRENILTLPALSSKGEPPLFHVLNIFVYCY